MCHSNFMFNRIYNRLLLHHSSPASLLLIMRSFLAFPTPLPNYLPISLPIPIFFFPPFVAFVNARSTAKTKNHEYNPVYIEVVTPGSSSFSSLRASLRHATRRNGAADRLLACGRARWQSKQRYAAGVRSTLIDRQLKLNSVGSK